MKRLLMIIGIRKEDKSIWEKRAPIIPCDVANLIKNYGIQVLVQSSKNRVFSDDDYSQAGATITDDLREATHIFAIKEIPIHLLEKGKTYVCFSHTTKGQTHNMPMLQRLIELECTLIDYEKIVDTNKKRLVYFGKYAGFAGMIDTLWALGRRLEYKSPFSQLKKAYEYKNLEEAKREIKKIGKAIQENGLSNDLFPFVCGFSGSGNVSKGAQEIFDLLPVEEIAPEHLNSIVNKGKANKYKLYKTVFTAANMVEPLDMNGSFERNEYYQYPYRYHSVFKKHVPYLTVFVNGIFWNNSFPRLITKEDLHTLFSQNLDPRLKVIGDISCDIAGSIECTIKNTDSENPFFVYDPKQNQYYDDTHPDGVAVISIDNLPCEFPNESSTCFSNMLFPFIFEVIKSNQKFSFDKIPMLSTVKDAVVVHRGTLTPNYEYLQQFLDKKELSKILQTEEA